MMNRKVMIGTMAVAMGALIATTAVTAGMSGQVAVPTPAQVTPTFQTPPPPSPSESPTLLSPTEIPEGAVTVDPLESVESAQDNGEPAPAPGSTETDGEALEIITPSAEQMAVMERIATQDLTLAQAQEAIEQVDGYIGMVMLADGGQGETPEPAGGVEGKVRFTVVVDGSGDTAKVIGVTIG